MADALVLGASTFGCGGSNPPGSTTESEAPQRRGETVATLFDNTKRTNKALIIIAVVAVLAVCGLCGGAFSGALKMETDATDASPPASASASASAAAQPTKTAPKSQTPAPKTWGDGVWQVGKEIPAGSYVTTADSFCYWARLRDDSGSLDAILANDNIATGERGRVGIKATDKFIEFTGGCVWSRV